MKNNALYPGTFDPITYGHIDVIKKALKIVDRVIIAVSENSNKNYLFELKDRRKFDYQTLKYLNKEQYIKKINL